MENDTNIGTIYLGMRAAAARAGISYGYLLRLCAKGRGPTPDATMPGGRGGKRSLWRPETIDAWSAARGVKGSWRNPIIEEVAPAAELVEPEAAAAAA